MECKKSVSCSSNVEYKTYNIDSKRPKDQGGERIKDHSVCECLFIYFLFINLHIHKYKVPMEQK